MIGPELRKYLFALLSALCAASASAEVWLVELEGAVSPASADHVIRGIQQAGDAGAELVILRIDTPGGLDLAMREVIKAILASPIPVAGYVAPAGARAASAGTYLLYATHLAVMAPGTNLGAATPVQLAGSPGLPGNGDKDKAAGAMEKKIINDAVAYIQGLAQLRDRNAQWAERAVRGGESLSAGDALEAGVVDFVAASVELLLQQADGLTVELERGEVTLQTAGLSVYHYPVDWRSAFLAVITNPNVAYILMLVGIYGLIIEFYNPGIGLPGVVGALCLLLALYALQVLPVSYAGLGLLLLGIALMVAEAFAPSFGILGIGGLIAFVIGSVMLMDTRLPAYRLALPIIAAFAVFSVALLSIALSLLLRSRRQASVAGVEHLIGAVAVVERISGDSLRVRLDGELWQAQAATAVSEQDKVVVDALDGLVLRVSQYDEGDD